MKINFKRVGKCHAITSALFLLAMVFLGGCATSHGPVPVKGMVTGRHMTPAAENASGDSAQEKAHYFLWVKTENGVVLVEVEEDVYQAVTEGEQICVNCN